MNHGRSMALVALLVLAAACGGRSHTADVARSPANPFASLDREYEDLMRAHGLAEWHEYTGEGSAPEGGIAALQSRERALFERAEPIARRVLASDESDPLARRRAELWRDGARGLALVSDPECASLSHRYESMLDAHVFEHDGQRLTRADLRRMATDANPATRRLAWELNAALHREVAEVARALLRRRVEVARALGLGSFGDAMLRQRGVAPDRWNALASELEASTRPEYHAMIAEGAAQRSLTAVAPWDLAWVLNRDSTWSDERLPAEGAVAMARRALGEMGFSLDEPPVQVLVREFSFGGQTLSMHVPDDVRTVVRPQRGLRFHRTLFHELGHGLQATRNDAREGIFKGYEWVPGLSAPGFDEGMAETFGTLWDVPDFLDRFSPFPPEERGRLLEYERRDELSNLRATLGSVAFERAALADPTQDLDALQRRVDAQHLGVDVPANAPATWAATPFLATYPVYRQSYVIAAVVAAQVQAALRERFGARWLSPEAARFVRESLFAPGETIPWEERVHRATGRALSPRDLIARLNAR